jgi:hypothetical protein
VSRAHDAKAGVRPLAGGLTPEGGSDPSLFAESEVIEEALRRDLGLELLELLSDAGISVRTTQ